MSTPDRLRGIVQGRSPVPELGNPKGLPPQELPPQQQNSGGNPFLGLPDYTGAALVLGGAVVERSEGAVIVVDREYRAGMLHGRLSFVDITSIINDGADAMTLMAEAWPSAKG